MDTREQELASALVASGSLTLRHLQLALEWRATSGRDLADVLFEMRAVPEDHLKETMRAVGLDFPRARGTQPLPVYGEPAPRSSTTRSFQRKPRSVRVVLPTWDQARRAYSNNISRGGLGFNVLAEDGPPPLGDVITLQLEMPDRRRFDLAARVRYAEPVAGGFSVGVEFEDLCVEGLLALDALIRQNPASAEPSWVG